MARKKKHEEHENHERWLVSYADFITLLFAFFVVMYAISSVNEGKYRVLSESLVASFRSPVKSLNPIQVGKNVKSPYSSTVDFRKTPVAIELPNMPAPRDESEQAQGEQADAKKGNPSPEKTDTQQAAAEMLKQISGEIEQAMADMIDEGLVNVRRSEHWVEVEINTSILFPSGSARISRPALPILRRLAEILEGFPNAVHVEGFTDNVPISNVVFPSNWELSAGRAASVVNLFMKEGIDPQRMVAIGYGQYQPVADNSSPEGRRKNRRVVVVVQSTADTRVVATELAQMDASSAAGSEPAGAEASTAAAHKGNESIPAQRPSNPGLTSRPGRFPVISPPIRSPVAVPVGSGGASAGAAGDRP